MGLLSHCPACCGQLVNIFITLGPYGLFRSNFAYMYLCIPILSSHPRMQIEGEVLPSIIFVGQGLLVKMLITLEPLILYTNTF